MYAGGKKQDSRDVFKRLDFEEFVGYERFTANMSAQRATRRDMQTNMENRERARQA